MALTVPQLSVAGALKVTCASHRLASAFTVMLAGHCTTGLCTSRTVTVKEQVPTLPPPSVLEQVTGVTPRMKRLPETGVHDTDGVPQLSIADAAKLTNASQRLLSQFAMMFVGQVRTGRCESVTRTVNVH